MANQVTERIVRSVPQRPRKHLENDILLVGQPNVGKSVLFSHLTGVRTIASNYPGTTVSYAMGRMRSRGSTLVVVDAPGTYSLEPLDEAARVTVDLIDDARRIINVVDSTHLERHLPLTLELIAQHKPMVVALNMSDEARHRGISIDVEELSAELGVPVVSIVDTNCNPEGIDYPIPGNDDGIRSVELIVTHLADAVLQGRADAVAEGISVPDAGPGMESKSTADEAEGPVEYDAASAEQTENSELKVGAAAESR